MACEILQIFICHIFQPNVQAVQPHMINDPKGSADPQKIAYLALWWQTYLEKNVQMLNRLANYTNLFSFSRKDPSSSLPKHGVLVLFTNRWT